MGWGVDRVVYTGFMDDERVEIDEGGAAHEGGESLVLRLLRRVRNVVGSCRERESNDSFSNIEKRAVVDDLLEQLNAFGFEGDGEKARKLLEAFVKGVEDMMEVFEAKDRLPENFKPPELKMVKYPVSLAYEATVTSVGEEMIPTNTRIVVGVGFVDDLVQLDFSKVAVASGEDEEVVEQGTPCEVMYFKAGEELAHAVDACNNPESLLLEAGDPGELTVQEYDSIDREYRSLGWRILLVDHAKKKGLIPDERADKNEQIFRRRLKKAANNRRLLKERG